MKTHQKLGAAAAVFCFASSAGADDDRVRTAVVDRDVSYEFSDDPLDASGRVAWGQRLTVRCQGGRTTLIRVRTQFVRELLKSAEDF